jgi:hypothetical protein
LTEGEEELIGSTGELEYWRTGVLENWSTGVLEYWSVGVLEKTKNPISICISPLITPSL